MKQASRREPTSQACGPIETPDFRTKVLETYMKDGRLVSWPSRFKRQYIIIEEIARRFEPGIEYTETQVNEMLKVIYPHDHCTIRRYLVDLRFVERKNGIYRR